MNRYRSYLLPAFLLLFTASLEAATIIEAVRTGTRIDVTVGGKFFTSYIFAANEKYPFFFPVNGPVTGTSVTSMRNAEYPHHSSLFFGCDRLNGGNYWQEGPERGQIISVNAGIIQQGSDTAVITDECLWVRSGHPSPVKDSRRYTITVPSPAMVQIDVEITLFMLEDVRIGKTNHSLFSVRMAPDLSVMNGGTMINARGDRGEKETFGKKSEWMDYYGRRGDIVEGLAIMEHPSNPWYPSPWFTRDYGFISPTPFYWPENDVDVFFGKGTEMKLRYRVLVHAGDHTEAKLAEQYEKYVGQE